MPPTQFHSEFGPDFLYIANIWDRFGGESTALPSLRFRLVRNVISSSEWSFTFLHGLQRSGIVLHDEGCWKRLLGSPFPFDGIFFYFVHTDAAVAVSFQMGRSLEEAAKGGTIQPFQDEFLPQDSQRCQSCPSTLRFAGNFFVWYLSILTSD